jgi:RNA polymerase sigma-70 factor (ECF subfamily)
MGWAVREEQTTAVVQRYLDELAEDSPAEPIVRALPDRDVRRHLLGATLQRRSYPRLTRPSWNVPADELRGAAQERMLEAKPGRALCARCSPLPTNTCAKSLRTWPAA